MPAQGPVVEGPARPGPMQDSVPQDTVEEPPPPPPRLPKLDPLGPVGWARGVWEWTRDDLLRLPDVSLLHLLERIPGVVPVRADLANQPESGAVFGAGAGAIQYVVDGFTLDPLASPTLDASRISLLALERVRVERRVTGVTVWIETLAPDDGRTKSVIEAGTGDYGINLFRGLFLSPRLLGGSLGAGFERLSADGFASGPSNHTVSWLKWTWVQDSAGIQVEYRQSSMDRQGVGDPLVSARSDWAVRARRVLGPVTAEAYVGASSLRNEVGGQDAMVIHEGSPQGGVRLGTGIDGALPLQARLALRFRGHPRLANQEAELGIRAAPTSWLAVEGEALQRWWSERPPSGRWTARARLGPVLGLQGFAEVTRGGTPVGEGPELVFIGPTSAGSFQASRDGARAGLHFQLGGLAIGGAALAVSADTVLSFGLDSEPSWGGVAGGEARGYEVMLGLPTGVDPIRLEGWYVGMDAPPGWFYLPKHNGRLGLVYHHLPLPSGNLELFARLEHIYRGRMNVPGEPEGAAYQQVGTYRATNFELAIRVVTVRAFLRWENLMHRLEQRDLPAYQAPGQRILWGVKWEFWN